jgi:hypothetical protein
VGGCGLGSFGPGEISVAAPSVITKGEEIFDYLSAYQFVKKDFVPWSPQNIHNA